MAANRICKVLKVNQDNERLMEEYERLASDVSIYRKLLLTTVMLVEGKSCWVPFFILFFLPHTHSSWNGSGGPFLG